MAASFRRRAGCRRRAGRGGRAPAGGSYLCGSSESSACSGRWLALPQSQLLSLGCLPHCTRPAAPRPARLAARREETSTGPIRAAVVGGGGAAQRRAGGSGTPMANSCGTGAATSRAQGGRKSARARAARGLLGEGPRGRAQEAPPRRGWAAEGVGQAHGRAQEVLRREGGARGRARGLRLGGGCGPAARPHAEGRAAADLEPPLRLHYQILPRLTTAASGHHAERRRKRGTSVTAEPECTRQAKQSLRGSDAARTLLIQVQIHSAALS
jgi:hypothetical protein